MLVMQACGCGSGGCRVVWHVTVGLCFTLGVGVSAAPDGEACRLGIFVGKEPAVVCSAISGILHLSQFHPQCHLRRCTAMMGFSGTCLGRKKVELALYLMGSLPAQLGASGARLCR
jgi:hypothetical protein